MKITKMIIGLAFSALLAVPGCGFERDNRSDRKDIATDWHSSMWENHKWLFYQDNVAVVRGDCPGNVLDRSSCSQNIKRVQASIFYLRLGSQFGQHQPELEQELAEANINIERTNTKLIELMGIDPTTSGNRDLLFQIRTIRAEIVNKDVIIADLKEQLYRVEQDLATHEDPSLRFLYADLQAKIIVQGQDRNLLLQGLQNLNQRYINDNSSTVVDRAMFDSLVNQRRYWVDIQDQTLISLESQLHSKILFHKTIKLLNDQSFSYTLVHNIPGLGEYWPVISQMNPVFEDVLRETGGIRKPH